MAYIAPIIAAVNKKKQDEEEESLMAEFMKNDKSGEWEYKIIRGTLGEFRSEARMQRALEAESRASWELAMKLDDERLVLRRPRSARGQDANLDPGVRPYRTDYGGKTILLIVGMLLLILGVIAFALFLWRQWIDRVGSRRIQHHYDRHPGDNGRYRDSCCGDEVPPLACNRNFI